MEEKIDFSIIIPHYNIPKLLRRCIDSIPMRSDLEVIVVDDNSSADKVDFDNFPGSERKDVILVLDKKGGGGGYARNLGLEKARGKWILFADADDYFTYCLNEMLDKYKDSDADVVFFNVIGCNTEYYTPAKRGTHLNRYINQANKNRSLAEQNLRFLFGEPWCKLIRRNVVEDNKIRFDCTPIHNDTTFSYLVGHYAKKVEIDPHAVYVLTVREKSVSKSINEEKRFVRIEVFARRDKFLRENHGLVDDDMAFHYREVYRMISNGEWKLAKKGIKIIRQYAPSSIYYRILKCYYRESKKEFKRKIKSMLAALHLVGPLEKD